ncbi:hypothetical protein M430DRAFT_137930 [Amorphotheca resinae ATCC 22711]|jgi:hypothetical protein|uniref:PH domain-like protein n=1 Tax=Amorphotheca resinae ATCC 22711 TaxID=857342 RepID=A0A2T3B705_AMORE|nr:hypothetical protein M430DRAFT_137930 [Amorphotheca resinae ATCC 22711]PSS22557.1 hypothetical protein M430DRAFT_137930 [Amorphotheca resinae ATCC 22711]
MTPRNGHPRHSHHHHQPVQASDYDSETAYTAPQQLPVRSNTELNLSVLRRYKPSISSILSIAASCQIYNYFPADQTWDKAEMAGTLFVCQLAPFSPASVGGQDRYCIIILNKKGLDNLIIEMQDVLEVEITAEIMIIRFLERGQAGLQGSLGEEKVLGFFIQDQEDTRQLNCTLIKEFWERTRDAPVVETLERGALETAGTGGFADGGFESGSGNGNPVIAGRRLSLRDLFGGQGVR